MNRREFLYAVAGGTAAIAGWVLIPGREHNHISYCNSADHFRPRMASRFAFRKTPGGGEIIGPDDQELKQVVCEVNESGLTIIENLDGKNSLQDVARILHGEHALEHFGHTEASVASFLALLAQSGVMSEPFFVDLESSEVTG
jgi:hypothetical protein